MALAITLEALAAVGLLALAIVGGVYRELREIRECLTRTREQNAAQGTALLMVLEQVEKAEIPDELRESLT